MSTSFLTLDMSRGYSRVRLFFSGALAGGAFTSTGYYAVANTDGQGASPTSVVAVFAVANNAAAVELAIEPAFTPGALYNITCTNVPAADSSLVTGTLPGRTGLPLQNLPNVEPSTQDIDLQLYDRDLVHDGNDFVETATGDLGKIAGRANWNGAIIRRMTSSGINWDPAYSPRSANYVNAPDAYRYPLAGALVAQARADDRTKQARVTIAELSTDPTGNGWVFQMTIIGKDGLDPLTVEVLPTALGL